MQNNIGKKVAFGGFVTALSIICLYMASILPTNRLFFYAIGSMFIFTIVVEFGVPFAAITYLATTALAFIIIPNKIMLIPYLLFFGYYGIIKYYVEKLNHLVLEWMIKLALFNTALYVTYWVVTKLLLETVTFYAYIWVTIILAEIAFVVYDLGYSMIIGYYKRKLRNRIR